ncbi:MAG TPA: ABC transporter substrate-binding protein [Bryobacteraceae bacterium]|nr:ABC transporter substrate-binding protein [Bryobacteraceae bacterium]
MLRIVSLIASATEIVHALGLTSSQVGRSHECDFPAEVLSLPVCTRPRFAIDVPSAEIDASVKKYLQNAESLYEVFDSVIEKLRPTHILTQTQCKVCAVNLEDVERAMSDRLTCRPHVIALEPNRLEDVWLDIQRVADACDVPDRGRFLIGDLKDRMSNFTKRTQLPAIRPRVACLDWLDPLMAARQWIPELIALAGAGDVFDRPQISWQDLLNADPDVIVSMPCGFDLARNREEMRWLTQRSEWPKLRAVRDDRVFVVDGNQYMNRPGPRIVESLQILAEILHPEIFTPTLERTAWQRWNLV